MRVEELQTYEVIEKREVADINSVTYLLKHKKTGAKVALISNDDDNKVFYIGFRTTPKDSTGVAHILEHSVLCGSREFPIKDPFIELCKGSLNTFLNAMTYPDKTIYPVASCNDKDFQNLMHVYLDAVFYPNIHENEAIFRQEGWHYEFNDQDELIYNGVVYNEMKGAFSSPDSVLYREISTALYPDTTYGWESGGDPENIPDLTYEQFKEFHRTYYHPSNSYIYLYGDMDMAEKLTFIDEHYLSNFDALEVDSVVHGQPVFTEPVRKVKAYSVTEGEDISDKVYLAQCYTFGEDTLDRDLYVALKILDYTLCSVPGAPLKQALTEKGIGKEIDSIYDNGIKQPYFSVVAKGTSLDKEEEFKTTIREVLEGIVKNGFNKKSLQAAINVFEFRYREADFGRTPKGLMYGIQALDSWLYDDSKPFIHVEANDTFARLREGIENGYFEGLIEKYLLNNPHSATVVLEPKAGLVKEQEETLKEKLAAVKAGMSEAEIQAVRDMMKSLEAFREQEDSPENLAKIPLLAREDLKREAQKLINEEKVLGDTPALYHNIFTNGIGYLRLMFKADEIPAEYFPYFGIWKGLFCRVNTANYSYNEYCNEMNLATGGIGVGYNIYNDLREDGVYHMSVDVITKALNGNLPKAFELIEELILTSDFADTKRIKEILAEDNSRDQQYMLQAGHSIALRRALSYGSKKDAADEMLSGVSQYRFCVDLYNNFEEKKDELVEKLQALSKIILRPENLMVDFTGDEEAFKSLEAPVAALKSKLYTCEVKKESFVPEVSKKNEGFMTPGQVQYVCRAGNFKKNGLEYTGALQVLQVMMGYEYLWTNVRVKGGAYGCMCGFYRDGACYFVSYRDPNLGQTIDVFEGAADFIANYEASERTMTQYIIGAFSNMDTPLNAKAKGDRSRDAYLRGITDEMIQKERNQVMDATPEDIRATAEYVKAFMSDEMLCVVGTEQKIQAESSKFNKVENLF